MEELLWQLGVSPSTLALQGLCSPDYPPDLASPCLVQGWGI